MVLGPKRGVEGDLTESSVRQETLSKMSDVKGEAGGVWLREESVGSNEVRVVDTPAVGEDGMYGEGEGKDKSVRLIDLFSEYSIT